ncbi:odorant receptor 131-2-like [Hoplias malabaricus]|uniref:odorant receptor 131-2-like n=1 Tax=Hoplias malabaricus TaxID=27720 RepID=UPI003462F764
MAGTNDSTANAFISIFFKLETEGGAITKLVVVILLTVFSIYVNCNMLLALRSKPVFKVSPRYILFAHMLYNDSIHLSLTTLMYALLLAFIKLAKAMCSLIMFLSVTTFLNAPLNLALMSLERYVAICYPLRHAEIATQKRTYIAIVLIWFFGSVNILSDILFAAVEDPNFLYMQMFCSREQIFIKKWQLDVYNAYNVLYFVTVTLIIVFTYIRILITARSVSSKKDSAKKAQRTVLLHLIQLGLCLSSFIYGSIERALYTMTGSNAVLFNHLRYLNFVIVLILPRCLSPLIYGLRDDAVRPIFKHTFCHGTRRTAHKVENL